MALIHHPRTDGLVDEWMDGVEKDLLPLAIEKYVSSSTKVEQVWRGPHNWWYRWSAREPIGNRVVGTHPHTFTHALVFAVNCHGDTTCTLVWRVMRGWSLYLNVDWEVERTRISFIVSPHPLIPTPHGYTPTPTLYSYTVDLLTVSLVHTRRVDDDKLSLKSLSWEQSVCVRDHFFMKKKQVVNRLKASSIPWGRW